MTPVSLDQMLATGITYRQLDHWCRQGYLRPDVATPGSGRSRVWTSQERDVALLISRMQSVGLELAAAVKIARDVADSAKNRVELGGGVVVSLESPRRRRKRPVLRTKALPRWAKGRAA